MQKTESRLQFTVCEENDGALPVIIVAAGSLSILKSLLCFLLTLNDNIVFHFRQETALFMYSVPN